MWANFDDSMTTIPRRAAGTSLHTGERGNQMSGQRDRDARVAPQHGVAHRGGCAVRDEVEITPSEVVEAYRANALFDAHKDDPEFGHRLLADEAAEAGEAMADRTAWRIASSNGWWSAFGKKRGKNGKKPGPPVHDDHCTVTDANGRVRHQFTADEPNQLWLTDITEHKTAWMRMSTSAGPRAAI